MALIYITGAGGSGKDSLQKYLLQCKELSLKKIPIYTTREKREGEQDGVEYFFCNHSMFLDKVKSGEIAEYRVYNVFDKHGNQIQNYYGTGIPSDINENDYIGIGTHTSLDSIIKSNIIKEIFYIKIYISTEVQEKRYLNRGGYDENIKKELKRRVADEHRPELHYFDNDSCGIPEDHFILVDNSEFSMDEFFTYVKNELIERRR